MILVHLKKFEPILWMIAILVTSQNWKKNLSLNYIPNKTFPLTTFVILRFCKT